MSAWDKGPAGVFGPDEGQGYWQPVPTGGHATLTMTPETFNHDASACGTQTIPPGGRIDPIAHRAAEKVWYVLDGSGELTIEGKKHRLVSKVTIAMGRKVVHSLVNDGERDLVLFFWITPPGYDDYLACIGRPRMAGETPPAFSANSLQGFARSPVLTGAAELAGIAAEDKGDWVVVGPEEGQSFWQGPPAGRYIQYKVHTEMFASNRFFAGIQVLAPGGNIPPHAHTRNEEWLLVRNGFGQIFVDGVWHDLKAGSLAFVSRWVTHSIRNDSDEDMEIFAVFTPPGLEKFLPPFSIARQPGEAEPEDSAFAMPDNAMELLAGAVLNLPFQADQHNAEALVRPDF